LVPVDSEHSAVLQCLHGRETGLARVILTASGGPFPRVGAGPYPSGDGGRKRSTTRPGAWGTRSRWTARPWPTRRSS
jgi:hypothetical protein